MYRLTDEQIAYVKRDIVLRGVELAELKDHLLDQVCCILEDEMNEHQIFEQKYEAVLGRFYNTELYEVEEETINLLKFKNYYAMKKIMIAGGAISVFAFISGSVLKLMHAEGAGFMLTLGILSFSCVFLPLMGLLKTKESTSLENKILYSIGPLVGILYSLSCLFAVMNWQGRTAFWMTTVAVAAFGLIPSYFIAGMRQKANQSKAIVNTVILVAATGLLFTMLDTRPKNKAVEKTASEAKQSTGVVVVVK